MSNLNFNNVEECQLTEDAEQELASYEQATDGGDNADYDEEIGYEGDYAIPGYKDEGADEEVAGDEEGAVTAPRKITTSKLALFLAAKAWKRAAKFDEAAEEARELARSYEILAESLPEKAPSASPSKAQVVCAVGDVVSFRHGRTTATTEAVVLTGTVKAVKVEDGKVKAYKVAAGEGFDEEFYVVKPGSILKAGETAEENEANETEE